MKSNRQQQGVALVITLIFLSVITVMAVAFLALTQRGRTSERESSFRTIAEQMADMGVQRSEGEILARILSPDGDFMGPGLTVSVNDTNAFDNDPTDLTEDEIALLQEDPRTPVFVDTNRFGGPTGPLEWRFYLDLNRNGFFETNGLVPALDYNGDPVLDPTTSEPLFEEVVGDPEWIGVLEDPFNPHSADNRMLGRYAFLIQPIGRSLDLNRIHNDAKRQTSFGFYRNQGFGPWEINLAAFLTDLNTNEYFIYNYNLDPTLPSGGMGFRDAGDLLNHRYLGNYANLRSFDDLFPGAGLEFASDLIDGYADSVPQSVRVPSLGDDDNTARVWPGDPGLTNFYTVHDFFDPNKPPGFLPFVDRLNRASQSRSTYDRYTFYRMLSQLGTDSAPPREEKININYVNIVTNNLGVPIKASEFFPWSQQDPSLFFKTSVDRMLRMEMRNSVFTNLWPESDFPIWEQDPAIGIPGIPVVVNGTTVFTNSAGQIQRFYSRRMQQLLQISANIYDSTYQSQTGETFPYYPTVLRPVFYNDGNDLYIADFEEVDGNNLYSDFTTGNIRLSPISNFAAFSSPGSLDNTLYYEVPMIVGARKGFPNLNEVVSQTSVEVSRKLEVRKNSPTSRTTVATNQMLIMTISNVFAMEAWYPYTNAAPNNYYPRDLELLGAVATSTTLTNDVGFYAATNRALTIMTNYSAGTWGGRGTNQFRLPPFNIQEVLPSSVYYTTPVPRFEPVSANNTFETDVGVFTNLWGLKITNRIFYALFDRDATSGAYKVVDVVSLNGLDVDFDVSESLSQPGPGASAIANAWDIRPFRNVTVGVYNQLQVAMGNINTPSDWVAYGGFNSATGDTVNKAIASFRTFMGMPQDSRYPTNAIPPLTEIHQAPFTPTRRLVQTTAWQVNDPLVHYSIDDYDQPDDYRDPLILGPRQPVSLVGQFNLTKINQKYQPWWGKSADLSVPPSAEHVNPALKDPGMWNPDAYDFPTNKFPNIGWLGRVHRGTPWQTIYLKSEAASDSEWTRIHAPGIDLTLHPTNDWRLVDLFTVALTPEMEQGRMSVNQTNLAAWSAVLSGVAVPSLDEDSDGFVYVVDDIIEPASLADPVQQIVAGITATRETRMDRQFTCVGDILSVPELTSRSPFLEDPYVPLSAYNQRDKVLLDRDYEMIPERILSLLKLGEPRFVIYSFGQSLRPSETVRSGPNARMPLNYEIVGEVTTRAVVRVEFEPLETDPMRPDYSRPRLIVEKFNVLPVY